MKTILKLIVIVCILSGCSSNKKSIDVADLPESFREVISELNIDSLGNAAATCRIEKIDARTVKVYLRFDLPEDVAQDDWQVTIKPAFAPTFNWAPHLTPTDNHVIDQHVFRSPAMIVSDAARVLTIIPDLDIMQKGSAVRWYMDMNAEKNVLTLGMCNNEVTSHVLFERASGTVFPKGKIEFGFYIMTSNQAQDIQNPFRKPLAFFWENWGHSLLLAGNPSSGDLLPFVRQTYKWAFDSWGKAVWQEFDIKGKRVGAPVHLVHYTQSPNYPGVPNELYYRSIWNQLWFSSLKSASGLYRYARRADNKELLEKANLTKELALSFPQRNGFFPAVIRTEMETFEVDGKTYNRSKGWNTYYFGNSDRNPFGGEIDKVPYHVADMSWTSLLMLRWYEELDKDARLLEYAETYGKELVKIQYANGFFPGYLDLKTFEPKEFLNDSPETSMSVSFLLKLYQLTNNQEYRDVALKAMRSVMDNIIPTGRWEDFETYWSCCRYGSNELVGKKAARNNMYKQCNFSMFWTAEALFECYNETGEEKYLTAGQRTLDELLMTQASWQPPYIYVKALGGFGVMNTDGEWNDSRQSLFAEIIIRYGKLLEMKEYEERGVAALRSSYIMMYCPENPLTKEQYEKVYPYFGEEDYGFTMENYGHGGRTNPEGEGIGPATHYDWGNGSAAEAYNRIIDRYGEEIFVAE